MKSARKCTQVLTQLQYFVAYIWNFDVDWDENASCKSKICVFMVWKVRTCRSYANYGEYKLKRLQFNTKDPRLGSCNKFVRCFHNSEFVPSLEKNLFFSGNCVCMMLSVDSVPSVSMDNALRVHATHSWSGSTSTNTNTKTITSS